MEQPNPFNESTPSAFNNDEPMDGALADSVGPRLPKRVSLVDETASTLRTWISSGVLTDILPGELQLKNRLGVGRDTLRLALAILTREGWVTSASKGCQRRIEPGSERKRNGATLNQLPVTFLSPHPVEHRVTLMEMEDTQTQLAAQGRHLRFISPKLFDLKHPERQLERLILTQPSAAWILYITSEAIQRWFDKRGIPAFLYELPYGEVNLPYVAPDWEGAAFHAALQLARHGHKIIGLLEYQERRPGILACERGLERGIAAAGAQGRLLLFKDDRSPMSVARSLELAFNLKERPTALVVSRATQLLTCYSWLAARGIRVPADVSLISLANDSWYHDLHPPVSHYEPDSKQMSRNIAERVLDIVTNGQTQRKSIQIQLNYCAGSTIGPVPEAASVI